MKDILLFEGKELRDRAKTEGTRAKKSNTGVDMLIPALHEVDIKLLKAVPRCISSRHRRHDPYRVDMFHIEAVQELLRNAEI